MTVRSSGSLPSADDFRDALRRRFDAATRAGQAWLDVNAGELHRELGGYPAKGGNHRMPVCCDVMRGMMRPGDEVLHQPPKGLGASLTIRYRIPPG